MGDPGRLLTAMVTPYTADGAVDYAGARRLARMLIEAGNDGVVVTGTTGEVPLLSDDEKVRLWDEIKQEVGEATVVAGAGTNDTRHSIALSRRAEEVGADAILAVAPYYLRPPQAGIIAHFRAIAESVSTPIIVYNVPSRTGVNMTVETLVELSHVPGIIGDKEANGDLSATALVMDQAAPGFRIWSGADEDNFHLWCMGAYGCVSVTGHLAMQQQRQMLEHIDAGRIADAAAIHRRLVALTRACFLNGSPSTIRYILRQLGHEIGEPRLPIVEPDEAVGAKVMAEIAKHPIDLAVPARV